MSAAGFEEFAEAVAANRSGGVTQAVPRYERITVLGGGADARLIAALCLAEGASVTLFSAYGEELSALRGGSIALRGAGPVGSYQLDQSGIPSIKTTAEIDNAVAGAEVIFLTGPIQQYGHMGTDGLTRAGRRDPEGRPLLFACRRPPTSIRPRGVARVSDVTLRICQALRQVEGRSPLAANDRSTARWRAIVVRAARRARRSAPWGPASGEASSGARSRSWLPGCRRSPP